MKPNPRNLQLLGGGYEKKSLEPAAPLIYRRSALAFLFSKATTTLKNQNLAYLIGIRMREPIGPPKAWRALVRGQTDSSFTARVNTFGYAQCLKSYLLSLP